MLCFLACLLVVSLYVLPYYLLPFQALRGHRDAPRTIRARALCSFGSCAAISVLLFGIVAARLRFDDDFDGDGGRSEIRRHHLVAARLALSDPLAWLRASFPLWAVRSLAPALAEAVASSLGAGNGASNAWRTAAAEAAEEARLRMMSSSENSSFVPSPAAATLRLLGCSPPSAAAPGALLGVVSICCLLAWPLAQRAVEVLAFGGRVPREEEKQQRQRWWRLGRRKRDDGAAPSSPPLLLRLPPETALRDLVIAPLTEEIAFRGCLLPVLLLLLPPPPTAPTAVRTTAALAFSSAAFASAHLHHAIATLLSPQPLPPGHRRAVALGAALQLSYTFAFGAAAGALQLASGSLAAPVAAHSLANFLGLPRSRRKSGSSSSLLLRRTEAAVGAMGVAAFALMAAGSGGRENINFVPFAGLASGLGAAGHGARYRSLAAALSL